MPIGSMKSCSRISPGWMGGSRLAMEVSSVVVDDLDIGGLRALPAKTHAELVVEANAVLTLAVAAQCFKAVARRDKQVVEASRPVELFELASRHGFAAPETRTPVPPAKRLRVLAAARFDPHWERY